MTDEAPLSEVGLRWVAENPDTDFSIRHIPWLVDELLEARAVAVHLATAHRGCTPSCDWHPRVLAVRKSQP